MKTIAETERLILREFDPLKDANNAYELNADPEVIKYTGDPPFESVQAAQDFLANYTDYKRNGYGRWAVELQDGTFIGWAGLKLEENGIVDLGYRFMKKYWGKGYATEAARVCLDLAFNRLGIQEVIGRTASENTGSIKVLDKCGFEFWKEDECNGIEDSYYYRISKSQYLR
ncbi:MAG: GNAT family N-acetyltransferase [Bacteroidia bacterium]